MNFRTFIITVFFLFVCNICAASSSSREQNASSSSSSGAIALSSSNVVGTSSSSRNSCYKTKDSADESLEKLNKECAAEKGENNYTLKKVDENCYRIEGMCDIHYSSIAPESSNSQPVSSSSVTESSSSEEYVYDGRVCRIDDDYFAPLKRLGNVHQFVYSVLPVMNNPDGIKVAGCSCNTDGSFKCTFVNFGLAQGYIPSYLSLCGLREAYWCPNIGEGPGYCNYAGSSVEIYYSDNNASTGYTWGTKDFGKTFLMEIENANQQIIVRDTEKNEYVFFTMRHLLPTNVSYYDLERAFAETYPRFPSMSKMNEYCRGEWVPHDEDCFGYASEAELAYEDSVTNCALSMGVSKFDTTLNERGWCVIGSCEIEPYEIPGASSSSIEDGSSSSEEGNGLCRSVPIAASDVPNDAKSSCFENGGRCYRCKHGIGEEDCRNSWTWQHQNNPVDTYYWFDEVDCATGEREKKMVGRCPVHPLDLEDIPSDLSKACFAKDGKCYKCTDPQNGCGRDWLWTDEHAYMDSYFVEETDCFDPFDQDDVCAEDYSDENIFMKRMPNMVEFSDREKESFLVDFLNVESYYDLVGRKTVKNKTKNQVLYKNVSARYVDEKKKTQEDVEKIFDRINLRLVAQNTNGFEKCGVLGYDYGVYDEDGTFTGGVTCPKVSGRFSQPSIIGEIEKIGKCDLTNCRSAKVRFKVGTTIQMEYNGSSIHYLKAGEKGADGELVSREVSDCLRRHEKGHQTDNQCIGNTVSQYNKYVEYVVESCDTRKMKNAAVNALAQETIKELIAIIASRFDNAADRFHAIYGSTVDLNNKNGKIGCPAENYVCPSDI